MKSIAIIGAGFCGLMTAVNLIKQSTTPIIIYLVENRKEFGKGVAYSTQNDLHLLNVPCIKMSAFSDAPEHFYQWLQKSQEITGINPVHDDFVPRKVYGLYLQSIFNEYKKIALEKGIELIEINHEAINILNFENAYKITFKNTQEIIADKILLATGNFLPRDITINTPEFYQDEAYFKNPWGEYIFNNYNPGKSILIIGSGLTMVDIVLSFYQKNHKGKIYVISPHGYIPQVHKKSTIYPAFFNNDNLPKTAIEAFKIVKSEIKKAKSENIDWRSVVDSIRPFTQKIWLEFSIFEKQQFMKHLRHKWGVMRHRMPPVVADIFYKMLESQQIEIFAGKIIELVKNNNITVKFKNRKTNEIQQLNVNKVINCTGPEADINKIENQLIQNLIKSGLIKADIMNLGIDATINGNVINNHNEVERNFYTIGTNLKGLLWESTAVPELRVQADNIATELLKG